MRGRQLPLRSPALSAQGPLDARAQFGCGFFGAGALGRGGSGPGPEEGAGAGKHWLAGGLPGVREGELTSAWRSEDVVRW